jgi:phenylacetate-coenzyme A ligase PaaK-like adenylate-forming protein
MILLADARITDYRVVQEEREQLHISVAIENGAPYSEIEQAIDQSVGQTIAQYGCRPARVQISEGIEPGIPGVKRRRVQRIIR